MNIQPTQRLMPLAKPDSAKQPDAKAVADQFEALLTHQLLQEMQKGLEGESLFGGGVEGNTLGAMAQWDLAQKLAETMDLGILSQMKAALEQEQRGDK